MSGLQRVIRHPDRANDPHERARELACDALLGPLLPADAAWLDEHLAGCGPCRDAAAAFAEDAALLRSLRADLPPVPRDLGARVSLSLDAEVRRALRSRRSRERFGRGTTGPAADGRPALAFVGLAAVAVVALIVGPLAIAPTEPPAGTPSAASLLPVATPLVVDSQPVAWVRRSSDGTYVLSSAEVQQVCPGVDATACGTLDGSARILASLSVKPMSVLLPRDGRPAVIVGEDGVYAVAVDLAPPVTTPPPEPSPVPSSQPVPSPSASGEPTSPPVDSPAPSDPPVSPVPTASAPPRSSAPPATPAPTPDPSAPTPSPTAVVPPTSPDPGATEVPATEVPATPLPTLPTPTPGPTAAPALAIAEAVVLVGAPPAYSADGKWVAFSARPADGSHGPDIYAWHVDQQKALALTADHGSVFSGWVDGRILASGARIAETPETERSSALPEPEADPATVVARSFLIDPANADVTEVARDGIWRPVVDPTDRLVVFWTGSLAWNATDMAWMPGAGRLAASDWQALLDRGSDLVEGPFPAEVVGPDVADWMVRFDPAGRRLGVWVADPGAPGTGRLALVAVESDGSLGAVLLADASALPGFSLGNDRLAWSTPPGRNGQGSLVTVFAWRGDHAGQLYGMPDSGEEPIVVVR
ncbi:MAG: zf-HC2 domain-containing protein [Chloroflexota bacterium]